MAVAGLGTKSTVFGFTLAANNLPSAACGTTFAPGRYSPAVGDGWDVMVAPLPPGDHIIHFGSSINDITYYVIVTK